jgi:hypothetical protein
VDGFDQDKPAGETDDSFIADVGLLATHSDAFEPLQLADRLFNTRPQFVESVGKKRPRCFEFSRRGITGVMARASPIAGKP